MVLLFLVLGFGFSGYLLPWNTLAFFATTVGTNLVGQVPLVGHWLLIFLRGGPDVTAATLGRFFAFHVALLPGIATGFILLHLLLIQRFGISVPPKLEAEWRAKPIEQREMPFFPNFLLRELMGWYLALGVLGTLAALKPWSLGTKADPFASAPAGIRPEWYFMFMFETLKLIPAQVWFMTGESLGVVVFGIAAVLWTLLPFFDKHQPGRGSRWAAGAVVFALAYALALTAYGYAVMAK
jgi:quinol-cytochrome oxidoreductase complex cytochrome b subunit